MLHRMPAALSCIPPVLRLPLLALWVILAVCPTSSGGEPADKVRIGYFANVTHAQAVLAVHSGELAKALAPGRLETRVFNAGPPLIEALFAGEIDMGYVGPSPAINGFVQSRGQGLRVIAGAAANGVVIVAAPGSGIEKLEDLKDRRVATPQFGNTQDMSARHYLRSVLGQPRAPNVLPIPNSEQVSMMTRGHIDAAWAVEPWGARLVAEAGGTIIAEEKDLWPGGEFALTLVIVSPEFLRDHQDTVERVLRVHREWTGRLADDSASYAPELAEALTDLTGKHLEPELILDSLRRVKFTTQPLAESIGTFARWSYDLGFSKGVPSVEEMIDTTVLDRISGDASDQAGGKESCVTEPACAPGQP